MGHKLPKQTGPAIILELRQYASRLLFTAQAPGTDSSVPQAAPFKYLNATVSPLHYITHGAVNAVTIPVSHDGYTRLPRDHLKTSGNANRIINRGLQTHINHKHDRVHTSWCTIAKENCRQCSVAPNANPTVSVSTTNSTFVWGIVSSSPQASPFKNLNS
jgi:hypothetical protein